MTNSANDTHEEQESCAVTKKPHNTALYQHLIK